MRDDRLLPLLGYDLQLAARLAPDHYAQLRSIATGWLCALVLVAWPVGYVFWVIERSAFWATLGPAGVFLLCLNLLRVAIAGGGASVSSTIKQVTSWRPGWTPSVFLFVLACLMAQPAHLLFAHHEHLAPVAAHRAALIAQHAALSEVPGAATEDAFTASLATCQFAVYRLQLLWASPTDASRFTALYSLLVLVPVFWTRYVALEALRAYERLRYEQLVLHQHYSRVKTAALVRTELSRWTPPAVEVNAQPAAEGTPPTSYVSDALTAPRQARRAQLILKWRAWE